MEYKATMPIKVCLVLKDRGWIVEKMAMRLSEQLHNWDVDAIISEMPSPAVDVNHWMNYNDVNGDLILKNSLAITHVDRPVKLHILKQRMKKADMAICLSRMSLKQLASSGIPSRKLCYITPAHDGNANPKRIVIGITSQVRLDGAKREYILIDMAKTIRLDAFHFEIIGPNWEDVIKYFKTAGATVNYTPGEYQDNAVHLRLVMERLNCFDFYLYMGWDEGSMGFLDALAAGIPTIVTPQGFHLDINGGITHSFSDTQQLCNILNMLAAERQRRIDSVAGLTWNEYARQHALVWHAMVEGKLEGINALLHEKDTYDTQLPTWNYLEGEFGATYGENPTAKKNDILLFLAYYLKLKHQSKWMDWFARAFHFLFDKAVTR